MAALRFFVFIVDFITHVAYNVAYFTISDKRLPV